MIDAQRQPAFDQHLTREVRSDATDSRTLARTPVFSVDTHIYLHNLPNLMYCFKCSNNVDFFHSA